MAINCGIVGLPNVGKSTLFSAITSVAAAAENYPFCTIEPNVGLVEVPDIRLDKIATIYNPKSLVPTIFEFVDIAGLVAGASKGEGLGNKFLSHIRETGIVAHVVRCFDNENITHVDANIQGKMDPINDIEVINTELALADLETVEKRITRLATERRKHDLAEMRKLDQLEPILENIKECLGNGKPVRVLQLDEEQLLLIQDMHLITVKPLIYVCNVADVHLSHGNEYSKQVEQYAEVVQSDCVRICGQLEAEIALLSKEARQEMLEDLGFENAALDTFIRSAYHMLGLRTFFTAGEKEVRAWTYKNGMKAPQTAGLIHTDFEKGFIRAEAFSCEDLFELESEAKVRSAGRLRTEGKEYMVQDGDILHFRFNV